jgi:hypothetical protein
MSISAGRIDRLRQAAQPAIANNRNIANDRNLKFMCAAGNAAAIAFVDCYGSPSVDEPLAAAMDRCSKTEAWKQCCRRYKEWFREGHCVNPPFRPDSKASAFQIGEPLRHWVIASFSGSDEKQKLQRAFSAVPPWLVWFTFGDYTAAKLGLTPPDLSGVLKFVRSEENFDRWWALPMGAFEKKLWPRGPDNERFARTGSDLLVVKNAPAGPQQLTTRERKRRQRVLDRFLPPQESKWPPLTSEEILRMSPAEHEALRAEAKAARFPVADRMLRRARPYIF